MTWNGMSKFARSARKPAAKTVHVDIDDRRQQAADDRVAKRLANFRLVDGVLAAQPAFALAFQRKVDQPDAILLHDADQQDDADDIKLRQ